MKEDGLLNELTKHLVDSDKDNARNDYKAKNLITENGAVEIEVPRDRNSTFEQTLIAKRERRFDGFDDKVLS